VSCHLCAYGSHWVPQHSVPQVNPTADAVGLCEQCYVLACPTHGTRGGGTGTVFFVCADCRGRLAVVNATSAPPPPPGTPGPPGGGPAGPPGSSGGGLPGPDQPGPGTPPPQPGQGASIAQAADLTRHPESVRWGLPRLSPALTRLRDLFDRDRLASAAEFVEEDLRRYAPEEIGWALGARLLAALNNQDEGSVMNALGLSADDPVLASAGFATRREVLEDMAEARAGALARELTVEALSLRPVTPRPPSVSPAGVPVDDIALLRDGLAALCAAHGYSPEQVFEDTLASPLDVPGALYLPAYPLQILFAYVDQSGLGPLLENPHDSPFISPATSRAKQSRAEASSSYA
jgi:hypothetical protein